MPSLDLSLVIRVTVHYDTQITTLARQATTSQLRQKDSILLVLSLTDQLQQSTSIPSRDQSAHRVVSLVDMMLVAAEAIGTLVLPIYTFMRCRGISMVGSPMRYPAFHVISMCYLTEVTDYMRTYIRDMYRCWYLSRSLEIYRNLYLRSVQAWAVSL